MRDRKGQFVKGHSFTDEMLVKMSEARKGKPSWNKGKRSLVPAWNKGTKGIMKAWNKGIHTDTNKNLRQGKEINCPVCDKLFYVKLCLLDKKKFCSKQCFYKGRVCTMTFEKGHPIIGGAHAMPHTEETKKKISELQREKNKDRIPNILSKIKRNISRKVRGSFQWKDWRSEVFKRDNYTCQECSVRGGYLEAHHIIPVREDRSLLFTIKNGITLCRPCHEKTMGKEHLFEEKYSSLIA